MCFYRVLEIKKYILLQNSLLKGNFKIFKVASRMHVHLTMQNDRRDALHILLPLLFTSSDERRCIKTESFYMNL